MTNSRARSRRGVTPAMGGAVSTASAPESPRVLGLCRCGPCYRLRRWHPSKSRGELERGRKLVEGEPVMVYSGARGRAGPAIPGLAGRVGQAASASGCLTIRGARGTGRDSDHDPVNVRPAGGVRVVDDERRPRWRRPCQRWRCVGPLAGVLHRDRRSVGERRTADRQRTTGGCFCDGPGHGGHGRRRWSRHAAATVATAADHRDHERKPSGDRCDSVKCARQCRVHRGQCRSRTVGSEGRPRRLATTYRPSGFGARADVAPWLPCPSDP
jgi:hypothetical protein